MTNDLTVDSLGFNWIYSGSQGSLRRETSRGASLPEELTIKHSTITVGERKFRRSVCRVDRYITLEDGSIEPSSSWMVHQSPIDANITSAEVVAPVQRVITVLSEEATTGLDLKDEIFANGEQ